MHVAGALLSVVLIWGARILDRMALPPAGYPQIQGRACGEGWTVPTEVTGQIPDTGFGGQFGDTVTPVTTDLLRVQEIGSNRDDQLDYATVIRGRIAEIRDDFPLIGAPIPLTIKERESIDWLLQRADAYLQASDELWEKWANRANGRWPLDQDYEGFVGGLCTLDDRATWKEVPGRGESFFCPSGREIMEHAADRNTIGTLYSDALAHVYCAEYGLKRLLLYKQAIVAYAARPSSEIGGFTTGPTPPVPKFDEITFEIDGRDPCRDLGVNCPPGEEPDGCPTQFCVDPDDLPDPGTVPEVDENGDGAPGTDGDGAPGGAPPPEVEPPTIPAPERSGPRPGVLIATGIGALAVTGIVYAVVSR